MSGSRGMAVVAAIIAPVCVGCTPAVGPGRVAGSFTGCFGPSGIDIRSVATIEILDGERVVLTSAVPEAAYRFSILFRGGRYRIRVAGYPSVPVTIRPGGTTDVGELPDGGCL